MSSHAHIHHHDHCYTANPKGLNLRLAMGETHYH